jgi:hypothetical protein
MCSYPKPARIRDDTLRAEVKAQGCAVNNRDCAGPVDPHHVKTRGAGGDDTRENLMPLCRWHHIEAGMLGVLTFIEKYGLGYCRERGRWIRKR